MTIAQLRQSSNKALSGVPKDLLVVAMVVLFSTASFGLGVLASKDTGRGGQGVGNGFSIEEAATTSIPAQAAAVVTALPPPRVAAPTGPAIPVVPAGTAVTPQAGKYVASKNGTKYYLPTCSGATRIKEANKVWFASVEDAQAAGLTAASNCPGL